MKYSARIKAIGPRVVLSFVAFLVVGAALTLILSGEMNAQSPSSDPLPAPELTATAIGGNAVDLSWTAVSGAGRYELWTWSGAWTRLDDGALTDTTYRHNGIAAGVTYYYAVRAVATDGTVGAWSEYISAAEDPTWTPTPTPTATATSTNRDSGPSTNPDGTPYQPGTGPTAPGSTNSGTGPVPPGGGSPSNPGTLPPLNGGQLPPSHGGGSSPESSNVPSPSEFTPVPTPVPPGHGPVPTATATVLLTVTPTASPTPTATPTPTWEPTATPTATAPALLAPGMTAMATVRGIELSWEAAAGAVRYELATWWDTGGGWQTIGGNNLTGTTYTHTDVTFGITYYYSIRAVNAAGETSGWLAEYPYATALALTGVETATPTPTPTPTPTATMSASSVPPIPELTVRATGQGVELRWEAVAGAVRYELATWWDLETDWQLIGGDDLTGTTYTHADVASGTTYYYSIRALNAEGEASDWLLDYPSATAR